ncbi:hypothetical protein JTB14_029015 [Gonioctena quinquepunctata]|nr:hypothetical protein JTB14_029015 [Gonioctena quinquepunctata]
MAEELNVVLNRSENSGFGFSLLGEPGLPPIIYNILEDSPAAESGEETGTFHRRRGSGRPRITSARDYRHISAITLRNNRRLTAVEVQQQLREHQGLTRDSRWTVRRELRQQNLKPSRKTNTLENGMRSVAWKNGLATVVAHGCYGKAYLQRLMPHPIRQVRRYLAAVGIPVMEGPACSPDLNPIEYLRDTLERRVPARNRALITLPQLKNAIQEEWDNIPQEVDSKL